MRLEFAQLVPMPADTHVGASAWCRYPDHCKVNTCMLSLRHDALKRFPMTRRMHTHSPRPCSYLCVWRERHAHQGKNTTTRAHTRTETSLFLSHKHMLACSHTHTLTHSHTHTFTHSHIHAHTQTHTHTHTHIYTHTINQGCEDRVQNGCRANTRSNVHKPQHHLLAAWAARRGARQRQTRRRHSVQGPLAASY